jgi:serine/threonine protein phosphatase PrpC
MNTHKPSLHLKTEFESYAVSGRFKRGAMQDGIMINYDLPEGLSIVGVADGVSTADLGSGESAVRILADVFEERAITYGRKLVDPNLWPEDAKLYLADTIEQANIEIVERWNLFLAQRTRPEAVEHPMSTTVVATIVLGDTAVIGWAGDSIAWHYEARTKRLYRLTIPHNNMTKHLSKGDLDILRRSPSGEDSHLIHIVGYGHFLPNSECFEPDRMEMDMLIRKFAENDLLILATDGLTECLHTTGELTRDMELEGLIANSMKKSDDLQSLCCKMVENADQQQGNDNISVLVMRFVPIPKPKPKQAQKCKTDNSQKMQ